MTREEKRRWLSSATNEELLKEYTLIPRTLADFRQRMERFGISARELREDIAALKQEVLRRMSR